MQTNGAHQTDERSALVEQLCAVADGLVNLPTERVTTAIAALRQPIAALVYAAGTVLPSET